MKPSAFLLLSCLGLLVPARALGFGATGHSLVGAIAQAKLEQTTKGRAVLKRALALLVDPKDSAHAGLSLQQAAPMPDDIRTWDQLTRLTSYDKVLTAWPTVACVPARPNPYSPTGLVGLDWPKAVRQQMWEYFATNCEPADGQLLHEVFHFCDVAVAPGADLTYSASKPGCGLHDIVHMIDYCRTVLAGQPAPVAAPAERVTKTVALVVLVHLLGDLHQPLHVGAQYFDAGGQPADPAKNPQAVPDQGGNLIAFYPPKNLHGHFDTDFVNFAVDDWNRSLKIKPSGDLHKLARALVKSPGIPPLQFSSNPGSAQIEQWATDGVRLSQQVHQRLTYSNFRAPVAGKYGPLVTAVPTGSKEEFFAWATTQTQQQIVRAGLRLAWILEQALP